MIDQIMKSIQDDINQNNIVLFMKGNADMPQCGFSSLVVSILKKFSVEFKDINILTNEDLRQAIKAFSDWPTIPQLYIKGEFIGGSDIVKEMYETGEFEQLLKDKNLI